VLSKGRPRGEAVVVAAQCRTALSIDGDVVVAEQHMAELDVGEGEIVPGEKMGR
jgi:hypothetical protein